MRFPLRMLAGACIAGTVTTAIAADAPNRNAPDADRARGEYLSRVAHCSACHTADEKKPYAGGIALASPFGTMYGSNLTQDRDTGIGAWTEQDFEGALRRGVRKGGDYLYPAMPYVNFTKMSDADVHALWVYFKGIGAIRNKVADSRMTFPFNIRPGIGAWQAVYFKQGRYVPDSSQSAEWNRGAYLVDSLGHCGACHTPTNFAMAQKTSKPLQGNVVDHWFAPDISGGQYSGIKTWSESDLVTYFKNGHNSKNAAAVGPMQQTIDLGTSQMNDADLGAIAVYLKHQSAGTESAPKTAHTLSESEVATGHTLYDDHCATCHGLDGKGVAGVAPALAGAGSTMGAKTDTAVRAVLQGFEPRDQWGVMPSFGQVLTASQVSDVVNYVRHSWGNSGAELATPSSVNHLARFSDIGNASVQSAVVCPSAAASAIDAQTIARVKELAAQPQPQSATAQLVREYRARHPKVATTELITTIGGTYCREVMAADRGTLAERQSRYVAFMGGVAQAAATRR